MLIQEDLGAVRHGLREVIAAGEPLNPEVIDKVRDAWGLTIRDFYGQTETAAQIGNSPGQPVKAGSMGRALPGFRIRLVDADGKDAQEGQIAIALDPAPAGLMRGYQQEDGSIAGLAGAVYRTGDVATRDAEGYITYVGRADDVFKASDYRISPFELESVLIEHPAVAEAAVVPAPDPMRLAVAKAYVSLVAGAAADRDHRAVDLPAHPRPARAVQARAPAGVRQPAEDDLGKNPPRRAAPRGGGARRRGQPDGGEFREEDFPELKQGAAPE